MVQSLLSNMKNWLVRPVLAQAPTQWTHPLGDEPAVLQDLEYVFSRALGAVLALGGLVAFVYLLVGGFRYITAGGDEKAVGDAKNTLTYAFLGLFIVVAAWLIINTLSQILGGTTYGPFLQFEIPK